MPNPRRKGTKKNKYEIESLSRGLSILTLFSREQPALTFSQIVEASGLTKSTAFRILSTLTERELLQQDPVTRLYRPGIKVLQLGFTAISSLEVRQVARPYLERLAQQVNTTASLSVLDGMEIVYVDRVRNQSIMGILLGLGSRVSAHCASMGKVMLAGLPPEELEARLVGAPLTACTPKSVTDLAALRQELSRVRQRGYALNDEELALGLRAVAAPIRDLNGGVVAAINVSGPGGEIPSERLVTELAPAVVRTAQEISLALGYAMPTT